MSSDGLHPWLGLLRQQNQLVADEPVKARAVLDQLSRSRAWPNVTERDATIAGVRCRVLEPEGAGPGVVVYVHGGGFHVGSFATHGALVRTLASALQRRTVFPEYRLAPEHPFPAGLDDVSAVLGHLTAVEPPVLLAGDSAGANLSLGAWQRLEGRPLEGLVLLSPWVDLSCRDSVHVDAPFDYLEKGGLLRVSSSYLSGADPMNPLASPAFAGLHGLPRTFVASGGDEVLREEIAAFVAKGRAAGGDVTHHLEPGVPHAYALLPMFGPARRRLVQALTRWRTSPTSPTR
ncbi:MAG: alpha/beta hydrolase fold domain-containing protein [Myxococcaceae bacterium]|nr:alpha/beta hydrolase fold domain-containing protein [Myxococcaceae bacterium]